MLIFDPSAGAMMSTRVGMYFSREIGALCNRYSNAPKPTENSKNSVVKKYSEILKNLRRTVKPLNVSKAYTKTKFFL